MRNSTMMALALMNGWSIYRCRILPRHGTYLSDRDQKWNGVKKDPIAIVLTELRESKAQNVQNEMEEVVDGQRAH